MQQFHVEQITAENVTFSSELSWVTVWTWKPHSKAAVGLIFWPGAFLCVREGSPSPTVQKCVFEGNWEV